MNSFNIFYNLTKPLIKKSINSFNDSILIEKLDLIKDNLNIPPIFNIYNQYLHHHII